MEKVEIPDDLSNSKWNSYEDNPPEKGKLIDIMDSENEKYIGVYRCNCINPKCKEIRSVFGGALIIVPKFWKSSKVE